ncbi:DUF4238 domain-containing protein [Phascolarctobacterium succinatutens]|uniref:DUF4238 domain-containing protein n=1 Tax=Phascolarctobacterium succinatutens TaxID=626940 RepID=UPI0026EDA3D6|nr:DUF4238 domain-containing protein [Phascolarctobacterium succinatutens]
MNETTKEKQHIVPQFVLRNFSVKDKLYTYDKHTEKIYGSSVKDSGCEKSFYDFQIKVDDKILQGTIEEKLCEIECNASRVIKKILKQDDVKNITDEEKEHMDYFLAAQMMRTKNVKENFKSMPEQLRNAIRQRMPKLANDVGLDEKFPDFEDDALNLHFDVLIANSTERLKAYFKGLEWILVKTDESKPFLIGDSPVIVYNELYSDEKESFYFSKYAIGYKGSCVFFPISPTRALWLVSPELIEMYVKSNKELLNLFLVGVKVAKDVIKMGTQVQDFINIE